MALLSPVFSWQNRLQAQVMGVEEAERASARATIESIINAHDIAIFTYGLSPFSLETIALLEDTGADFHIEQIGLEWFLLGREASALRLELLEMTKQSSLPHVFICGRHVGGLYSGPAGGPSGLAALRESGELQALLTT
mmetsp:Transcript_32965/g.65573  ORF Transcript_32965/g.65573 Transcript_32965/m.65573 type:complete len:139 (-) Transcript_32965:118-534(-)|eukprot:CAMPEP_0174756702 /NCGR_PEP_ID=MMETSP1094-20130205/106888_1 /TAXON_ID=156173 /ORGANISM="Chrysochromulina brevifilum, Strain UTEX LB 985" /LENGTH=138 /DNA_ID=CAMNT_0015962611 /DNA_START=704 /DNA_END=1120 /DNA_ORIENTATION=-